MTQLPSLDLLRRLSDRAVLDQLLGDARVTRAEIAARTTLSKPTVSESVRRMAATGLVVEAGEQAGGRGRAGTYYRLADDAGAVAVLDASADGVRGSLVDLHGGVVRTTTSTLTVPVESDALREALRRVARRLVSAARGPVRATSVSVADPVDRASGRVVQLPDSPFLVGELDPRQVLQGLDLGAVEIDNDVNWAARAERRNGCASDLGDYLYCYLGAGVGAAVAVDGEVRRGSTGLAGELQQMPVAGPAGPDARLVEHLAAWSLTVPGSTAIDVERIRSVLAGGTATDRRRADALVTALGSVLCAAAALVNPQAVVLGGPWHDAGDLVERLTERLGGAAVPTEVRRAVVEDAPFRGATLDALDRGREALLPG